jgi:hypothetical protein
MELENFLRRMKRIDQFHLVVADAFCRSSIIKLLVSFEISSIFNEETLLLFDGELRLLLMLLVLLLLLLYFSSSLSSAGVGMITEDCDFSESS